MSEDDLQTIVAAVSAVRTSPWFTLLEAAAYCRCGKTTVQTAVDAGLVKRFRATGADISRFHRDDLDRWIQGKPKRQ